MRTANRAKPKTAQTGMNMKELAENAGVKYTTLVETTNMIGCHEIDRIQEMRCAPRETGCWDCNRRGTWIDASDQEVSFGDWTPGRFAWEFADVKAITPVRVGGRQGLWDWRRT